MPYDPNNPRGHYDFDVRVPESVIDQIRELGMAQSVNLAKSGSAEPEFIEGVRRFYPFAFADEPDVSTAPAEVDPLSGVTPEESSRVRLEDRGRGDPALPPQDGLAPNRPRSNPVIPLAGQEEAAMNDPSLDDILLSAPDGGQGMLPGESGTPYLDHFRGEAAMRPTTGPGGGAAAVPSGIPGDVSSAVNRRFSVPNEDTISPEGYADAILGSVPEAPSVDPSEVIGNARGLSPYAQSLLQEPDPARQAEIQDRDNIFQRFNEWRVGRADRQRAANR